MGLKEIKKWTSKHTRWVFSGVIAVLAVGFIVSMSEMNITQNVESRALSEVRSTMDMQISAFSGHMSAQFQVLELVSDMLGDGSEFDSEEMRLSLKSIVETYELCTLCLADVNGNTVDYEGNILGSCVDREYFREIMNGKYVQLCEFLPTTKETSEPRIILSIPAYDKNENRLGVLFCSKEIYVLEDALFADSALPNTSAAIFICDVSGNVIAANENGHDFSAQYGIENDEGTGMSITNLGDDIQKVREADSPRQIKINGNKFFAGYRVLDECGWGMYCIMDEVSATAAYKDNQKRIERTITTVFIVFAVALIYIIFLGKMYLRRRSKEAILVKRSYENYKNILHEVQCAVVEYDLDDSSLMVTQSGLDELKLDLLNGSLDAYKRFMRAHPEYDFDELKTKLELAKADGRTYSFESSLTANGEKICWIRTTIIPISDEDGMVDTILFAIFDISEKQREIEKIEEEQEGLLVELDDVKKELEYSRIKTASSQMQPHFLYNALSSIREIVLEDPQYASDLIYDFTTHLRACIRSMSSDSMITFAQELENIKAYVNIEKMRFGDRLHVVYDCPVTDFEIIPLSIQPLVENAIRHGIYDRGAAGGTVTVRSDRIDNSYVIYVWDDGMGFNFDEIMSEVESGERDSRGLANLIFRFATLMNADVNVDSQIGYGTKITITIPIKGEAAEERNVQDEQRGRNAQVEEGKQ